MSVRNLLPPESAKILVLQVKVRIVREKVLALRPTAQCYVCNFEDL